jgi:hypothetical protein
MSKIKREITRINCDNALYENGILRLVTNTKSNAELIKDILDKDEEGENYVFPKTIAIGAQSGRLEPERNIYSVDINAHRHYCIARSKDEAFDVFLHNADSHLFIETMIDVFKVNPHLWLDDYIRNHIYECNTESLDFRITDDWHINGETLLEVYKTPTYYIGTEALL